MSRSLRFIALLCLSGCQGTLESFDKVDPEAAPPLAPPVPGEPGASGQQPQPPAAQPEGQPPVGQPPEQGNPPSSEDPEDPPMNPEPPPQEDPPGDPGPAPGPDPGPPDPPESPPPEGQDRCGDVRATGAVYFGTDEPTHLPMSPGQQWAVANFNGCSGTLIAPTWVLSATHCGHRRGASVCFGQTPRNSDVCVNAARVIENPQADQTLVELDRDMTQVMPGIVPIPILTEELGQDWIGRTAEAAGYGQQDDGGFGTRKFTAQPIVRVQGNDVTIDGEGRRGVCFGDSGGPLMVIANDGTVRVVGDLSNGDGSCVGRDNYTRVGRYRDWIEQHTGPTVVDGAPCGEVTAVGRCMGTAALFCGPDDELVTSPCANGTACGWDAAAAGFRCIQGADPCGGADGFGACDGNVARWCENGVAKQRDCGACEQSCGEVPEINAIGCQDDPCANLGYEGRCEGDVAHWCDEGIYKTRDCAERGQSCGWVNDELGFFCR